MVTLMGRFMEKVMERQAKAYIAAYCKGIPVEDFRYAAENNMDILLNLLKQVFLKPGEEKSARNKAAPYRHLVERLATTETLIRITSAVAPEHAKVLRQHTDWFSRQLRSVVRQVFDS